MHGDFCEYGAVFSIFFSSFILFKKTTSDLSVVMYTATTICPSFTRTRLDRAWMVGSQVYGASKLIPVWFHSHASLDSLSPSFFFEKKKKHL